MLIKKGLNLVQDEIIRSLLFKRSHRVLKGGTDVDDCAINTTNPFLVEEMNATFGKRLRYEDLVSHEFDKLYHCSYAEWVGIFEYTLKKYHSKMSAFPGMKELLVALNIETAITKRDESFSDVTYKQITRLFTGHILVPTFCSHGIQNPKDPKKEDVCMEEKLDYFIEDNPATAIAIAQNAKIPVFMPKRPWNGKCRELPDAVFSVREPEEILELMKV